jgi:hypothetical protein
MKIQNAKISSGGGSSFGGKNQNYNEKLKINKIQTPVITSYPEASGDEAIPIVPSCHCESRPFVNVIASADASARSNLFE